MDYYLTADLGGTDIKLGLVQDGEIAARQTLPAEAGDGLRRRLPVLRDALIGLCRAQGLTPGGCAGLGMAVPCIVDSRQGRVLSVPNGKYDDAATVDLVAWARQELGLPLKLENDAHAALLGEWKHGAGEGCDNLVMITLGTGIGCSVMVEGYALRGCNYRAGLLGGHIVMTPGGRACIHPGGGCVEAEVGTWALPAAARSTPGYDSSELRHCETVEYKAIFSLAAEGDAAAILLAQRAIQYWGAMLVSLVHLFDPQRVILGGGIMRSADAILPGLCDFVAANSWSAGSPVEIVRARCLTDAALLGCAVLHRDDVRFL